MYDIAHFIEICYPGDTRFHFTLQAPASVTDEELLETVFAQFNAGSGQECQMFL